MNFKKIIASMIGVSMLAAGAFIPAAASAQVVVTGGSGVNALGTLFTLDQLFRGPFGTSDGFTTFGDTLIWNQLLNNTALSGLFSPVVAAVTVPTTAVVGTGAGTTAVVGTTGTVL